jgi:hypothetical protein
MAKAHEEKIRAMKDIEDKKNAEIKVRSYFEPDRFTLFTCLPFC